MVMLFISDLFIGRNSTSTHIQKSVVFRYTGNMGSLSIFIWWALFCLYCLLIFCLLTVEWVYDNVYRILIILLLNNDGPCEFVGFVVFGFYLLFSLIFWDDVQNNCYLVRIRTLVDPMVFSILEPAKVSSRKNKTEQISTILPITLPFLFRATICFW